MAIHFIMFLLGWFIIGVGVFVMVTNLKQFLDK